MQRLQNEVARLEAQVKLLEEQLAEHKRVLNHKVFELAKSSRHGVRSHMFSLFLALLMLLVFAIGLQRSRLELPVHMFHH